MSRPRTKDRDASKTGWTTLHEKRFLEGMGIDNMPRGYTGRSLISRLEKLKRYRKAMSKRYYWGDINSKEIEKFVDEQIKRELNVSKGR